MDGALRANVARGLEDLGFHFPELLDYLHGAELGALHLMEALVAGLERDAKEVAAWQRGAEHFRAQCAWVKHRASLEKEIDAEANVDPLQPRVAVHPAWAIAEAERDWLPRWTRRRHRCHQDVEAALSLSALPELPVADVELLFCSSDLVAIAKGTCAKLEGRMDGLRLRGACSLMPSGIVWRNSGRLWCGFALCHACGATPGWRLSRSRMERADRSRYFA